MHAGGRSREESIAVAWDRAHHARRTGRGWNCGLRYLRGRITRARTPSAPLRAARVPGGSVDRPWSFGFLWFAKFASNLSYICRQAFGCERLARLILTFPGFRFRQPGACPVATSVRPRPRRTACMHSFTIEAARIPLREIVRLACGPLGSHRAAMAVPISRGSSNRRGQWRRPCVESVFSSDTFCGSSPLARLYIQNEGLSETF